MEFGTITCNGTRLTSSIQNTLYKAILHSNVIKRLSKKLNPHQEYLHTNVNWEVMSTARREARLKLKIFITKWISNVIPTGVVMCERRQRISSNCPICDGENEDTNHILRCSDPKVQSLRNILLKEMKCWMNSIDTHPDIITFVVSGLSSWLSSENDFNLDATVERDMLLAFKTQIKLGWDSFLLGMIAKQIIQ